MYLGIGDSGGAIISKNNKKLKSYTVWCSMFDRCYSESVKINYPSYKGCTVCDEWLFYPKFIEWFNKNYKEGFHLDKDLKNLGAKVYSPDNCSFIPARINSLIISCKSTRGDLPIGVALHKASGLMTARFCDNGKRITIGYFKCEIEAFNAYKDKKLMHIIKIANESFAKGDICEKVFANLIKWEIKIDD